MSLVIFFIYKISIMNNEKIFNLFEINKAV